MTTEVLDKEQTQAAEATTTIVVGKIDFGLVVADVQKNVAADLALTIDGPNDEAGYALADKRRKEWVHIRCAIDKQRKGLNAQFREQIKKVDSIAEDLQSLISPAEAHVTKLVDDRDAALRKIEQDKRDAIFNARDQQLRHAGVILERIVIESLSDEAIDAKIADAIELARLRKEEADRQAAAEAERQRLAAEEKERNRIEAERLAKERAEFDRIKAEQQAETDRLRKIEDDRIAEERRKLDEEKAVLAKAQREQAEREAEIQRKADEEKARIAKIESDRVAAEERERMAKEFADRARVQAEEKAKRDEAARMRAEQLRPSKEKLLAIAEAIANVPMPLVGAECHEALREIKLAIGLLVQKIKDIVGEKIQ